MVRTKTDAEKRLEVLRKQTEDWPEWKKNIGSFWCDEPCEEDISIGKGENFEHIRRITGYLVGSTDRFNNAKRAEEQDRVKHNI